MLISNRRWEHSSLKQWGGGKGKSHGDEMGWEYRVRLTSGGLTLPYNHTETHLQGEGKTEKTQVTWNFAKMPLYPFRGSCAAFEERFAEHCPAIGQSRRVMESRDFL